MMEGLTLSPATASACARRSIGDGVGGRPVAVQPSASAVLVLGNGPPFGTQCPRLVNRHVHHVADAAT